MEEEKVEVVKKPYSKEKIGVTVMLVGLTAAIFLAIGYWAGSQSEQLQDSETVEVVDTDQAPPVPVLPGETVDPSKETETDETANWQTYTNDEYGFSFKYPGDWEEDESKIGEPGYQIGIVSPETKKNIEKTLELGQPHDNSPDIMFYSYDSVASESENASNNFGATTLDTLISTNDAITPIGNRGLGGTNAKDVIRGGYGAYYTIFAVKNSHLYEIRFGYKDNKSKLTSIDDQILSTFQFTK